MLSRALYYLALCVLLLFGGIDSRAGMTSYTDRGKADFDTVLQLLNSYGTWSKIDGAWAYTPLDHLAPYTHGRWIYTEYGWYWKGDQPHSWATEHYGYWKRGTDKVWSWYPGPFWLPEIVELRATDTSIGWRSAAVDQDGNFIEAPSDRYAKTDEWTFVTRAQFAGPITPGIVAKPDVARDLLDDSTDSRHTYMTYRAIDRPGPHPADLVALAKDGGMLPPESMEDKAARMAPPPKPKPDPNSPAAHMTGTNAPALLGAEPDQPVDTRQVKYWITMSLPTYWTKPPADAKPEDIYLYRPDFYQDQDGIARRITLWFNPQSRASLRDVLAGATASGSKPGPAPKATPAVPAVPAVPATSAAPDQPAKSHDPFRSPFDDSFHPSSTGRSAGSDTRAPSPPSEPQPNADHAPVAPPVTNAAPTTAPAPLPATNAATMVAPD